MVRENDKNNRIEIIQKLNVIIMTMFRIENLSRYM